MKLFLKIAIVFFILFIVWFIYLVESRGDTLIEKFNYHQVSIDKKYFSILVRLEGKYNVINRNYSKVSSPYILHFIIDTKSKFKEEVIFTEVELSNEKNEILLTNYYKKGFNDKNNIYKIYVNYRNIELQSYSNQKVRIKFYFKSRPEKIYIINTVLKTNYEKETSSPWSFLLYAT